jgi:hypothetical protein
LAGEGFFIGANTAATDTSWVVSGHTTSPGALVLFADVVCARFALERPPREPSQHMGRTRQRAKTPHSLHSRRAARWVTMPNGARVSPGRGRVVGRTGPGAGAVAIRPSYEPACATPGRPRYRLMACVIARAIARRRRSSFSGSGMRPMRISIECLARQSGSTRRGEHAGRTRGHAPSLSDRASSTSACACRRTLRPCPATARGPNAIFPVASGSVTR